MCGSAAPRRSFGTIFGGRSRSSPPEEDVAADVFRFLVTPSGTKIAHGVGDLADYASVDEQRLLPVLSTLGGSASFVPSTAPGANGARYEIFHDVLGEAVLAWRREQELERERRAAEQRHRRLAIVAVLALVALAAMTAVAIYASPSARRRRATFGTKAQARELVARSSDMLNEDPLESVAWPRGPLASSRIPDQWPR